MNDLALFAGTGATAIFVISQLPMLIKAARTRDLSSYSFANIGLANLGNALYTVYVLSVPVGPVWALHGFNLATAALMLFWYLRHGRRTRPVQAGAGAVMPAEPGGRAARSAAPPMASRLGEFPADRGRREPVGASAEVGRAG